MQDTMGYDVTRQSLLTRYNPNSPAPGLEEFFNLRFDYGVLGIGCGR